MRHQVPKDIGSALIVGILGSIVFVCVRGALGQSLATSAPAPTAPPVRFDVVSIKPNKSGDFRMGLALQPGGRFTATNTNVKGLIRYAFNAPDWQMVGGPDWIIADHFDVEAKADRQSETMTPNVVRPMVQLLLEDRFQLKTHHESRELPVYELVVAKGGPKKKLSEDQTPPVPQVPADRGAGPRGEPGAPRGSIVGRGPGGSFMGNAVQIAALINFMSQPLGRPIIDKTDLKGLYDFTLQFTPEPGQGPPLPPGVQPPPRDPAGPSIFTALQDQLGLQLESKKSPLDVIVIDGVQRPSEN
jgi:uncharacterized protein (TIGR03435 family)